jgi:hypothetical protein
MAPRNRFLAVWFFVFFDLGILFVREWLGLAVPGVFTKRLAGL